VDQRQKQIEQLEQDWIGNPRWAGLKRGYGASDVVRLRGSVHVEHSLAKRGAEKLWRMMHERPFVNSLGALTGNQAVQQVKAGVPAIYLSGWQVAADANDSLQMYPDQSLYAVSSVPTVVSASTMRSRAPTRSSGWKAPANWTITRDRRRRRGRLRRRAQRL